MCCHRSGFDVVLAEQLRRGAKHHELPKPEPKSKLHRASKPAEAPRPPRFSQADRRLYAQTPQGRLFLESIGQLPDPAATPRRSKRRHRRKRGS